MTTPLPAPVNGDGTPRRLERLRLMVAAMEEEWLELEMLRESIEG